MDINVKYNNYLMGGSTTTLARIKKYSHKDIEKTKSNEIPYINGVSSINSVNFLNQFSNKFIDLVYIDMQQIAVKKMSDEALKDIVLRAKRLKLYYDDEDDDDDEDNHNRSVQQPVVSERVNPVAAGPAAAGPAVAGPDLVGPAKIGWTDENIAAFIQIVLHNYGTVITKVDLQQLFNAKFSYVSVNKLATEKTYTFPDINEMAGMSISQSWPIDTGDDDGDVALLPFYMDDFPEIILIIRMIDKLYKNDDDKIKKIVGVCVKLVDTPDRRKTLLGLMAQVPKYIQEILDKLNSDGDGETLKKEIDKMINEIPSPDNDVAVGPVAAGPAAVGPAPITSDEIEKIGWTVEKIAQFIQIVKKNDNEDITQVDLQPLFKAKFSYDSVHKLATEKTYTFQNINEMAGMSLSQSWPINTDGDDGGVALLPFYASVFNPLELLKILNSINGITDGETIKKIVNMYSGLIEKLHDAHRNYLIKLSHFDQKEIIRLSEMTLDDAIKEIKRLSNVVIVE